MAAAETASNARRGSRRCCGSGSWCIVGFFTFSAAKQDLYIFPIVPAVAALAGAAHCAPLTGASSPVPSHSERRRAARSGCCSPVAGAGNVLHLPDGRGTCTRCTGARVRRRSRGRRRGHGARCCGTGSIAPVRLWPSLLVADHAQLGIRRPGAAKLRTLQARASAGCRDPRAGSTSGDRGRALQRRAAEHGVSTWAAHRDSVRSGNIPRTAARRAATSVRGAVGASDYAQISTADLACRTCVLDRRPTVNIKLKAVLARDPLPEVLLITNRCK